MIEVGSRVRLKNDPSVTGIALGTTREVGGRLYQGIRLADGNERNVPVSLLEVVAAQADPFADLRNRRWSAPSDLARLLTHVRLTGRLADLIYSMESTNTVFHAYQFKPVIKVLNSATKGLLIADEVGLGKTIEAGLIWTELAARYDFKRLLVVCPKSLQQKWRAELRQKFNVTAQIQDAAGLITTLSEASSSGDGFAVVSSLSALRPPRGWADDDPINNSARAQLARLLTDGAGQDPLVDLVIFDEAHHLRNPDTAQHRLGQLLVDVSDYRLLLSATPINLRSGDLQALLKLLDPDLFQRPTAFDQLQRENEPILAARQKVLDLRIPLADVAEELRGLTQGELLKTDMRLEILRRQLLDTNRPDGPAYRAELAARLEEMSMLGGIVNRTRRRDVNEIQVVRRAEVCAWQMNSVEREFYDEATEAIRKYALTLGMNELFLLATAQRLISSSLPAAYAHWRSKAPDLSLDEELDEEQNTGPLVSLLAAICRDPERQNLLERSDSKLAILERSLGEVWEKAPSDKIIVFSSFRRSIDYLHAQLTARGITSMRLHGSIDEDRDHVLTRFEEAEGPTVLLTSEVGGEGLDLQFCRVLINYDLPWNPMRVEQRIGRIDRIGQASPTVDVLSLVCEATIEERIYHRLYDRLNLIERTLGGFEAILGPILSHLERRLLDPELTEQEQAEEINRAATAIETQRLQQDQIEEEAPALIAHGDMILNRVRTAHEQQKWIQPDDLHSYVKDALQGTYPSTRLDRAPIAELAYDLRFSADAHVAFIEFLNRKARRYSTQLRNAGESKRIVFGRSKAAGLAKSVEPVAMGHPLVRFAAELVENASGGIYPKPAVCGVIPPGQAVGVDPGRYVIVVQRWSASGLTEQEKLVTGAMRIGGKAPLGFPEAEALASAFVASPYRPSGLSDGELLEASAIAERVLRDQLLAQANEDFLGFEAAVHGDKHATRLAVLKQQRDMQSQRLQARISDLQIRGKTRAVTMERGKLALFMARMDQRLADTLRNSEFSYSDPVTLAVAVVDVGAA
jgi:superfamily II DNA or RNA helicase